MFSLIKLLISITMTNTEKIISITIPLGICIKDITEVILHDKSILLIYTQQLENGEPNYS